MQKEVIFFGAHEIKCQQCRHNKGRQITLSGASVSDSEETHCKIAYTFVISVSELDMRQKTIWENMKKIETFF